MLTVIFLLFNHTVNSPKTQALTIKKKRNFSKRHKLDRTTLNVITTFQIAETIEFIAFLDISSTRVQLQFPSKSTLDTLLTYNKYNNIYIAQKVLNQPDNPY